MKNIYEGCEYDLREMTEDDPDRPAFEQELAEHFIKAIDEVRARMFDNLWLLIASLKNPEGDHGFHTWLSRLGKVIGKEKCAEIGQRICKEKGFTIEEGEKLRILYRQLTAQEMGLPKNATWEEIGKKREERMLQSRHQR